SSLLDKALHHRGPHYFLAYGALFAATALGEHRQQRLNLKDPQYTFLGGTHSVGLDEFVLHLSGNAAITEGIFLQRLNRRQEHRHIVERNSARSHPTLPSRALLCEYGPAPLARQKQWYGSPSRLSLLHGSARKASRVRSTA